MECRVQVRIGSADNLAIGIDAVAEAIRSAERAQVVHRAVV